MVSCLGCEGLILFLQYQGGALDVGPSKVVAGCRKRRQFLSSSPAGVIITRRRRKERNIDSQSPSIY